MGLLQSVSPTSKHFLVVLALCLGSGVVSASASDADADLKAPPVTDTGTAMRIILAGSDVCQKALSRSFNAHDFTRIENRIREKAALLAQAQHYPSGLSPVANQLMIQYMSPLLAHSREHLMDLARQITQIWIAAHREKEVSLNYAELSVEERETLPYFFWVPFNPRTFYGIARLIEQPELFSTLPQSVQDLIVMEPDPNTPVGKDRKVPLRLRQSPITLSAARNIENQVRGAFIAHAQNVFRTRLNAASSQTINSIEGQMIAAASSSTGLISSWDGYVGLDAAHFAKGWLTQAPQLLREYVDYLSREFPISRENPRRSEINEFIARIEDMIRQPIPSVFGEAFNPVTEQLYLKSQSVVVRYSPELGTSLMTAAQGDLPNPKGPMLMLLHGDGTNHSTGASFQSTHPLFTGFGFNAIAYDRPDAGTGLKLNGDFHDVAQYNEYVFRRVSERYVHDSRPLIGLGRSMGAQWMLISDLMHPNGAMDAGAAMSYSQPETLALQFENILYQLAHGIIKCVVQSAIDCSQNSSDTYWRVRDQAVAQYPEVFNTAGNTLIVFQGNADSDAKVVRPDQMEVVQGAFHTRDRYFPALHVVPFFNPLMELPQFQGSEVEGENEELHEATHFLIRNNDDMTDAQARANPRYRDLPAHLRPKVRSQSVEVLGHIYGLMSYLRNGLPSGAPWPTAKERRAQARFRAMQTELTGGDDSNTGLFNWYLSKVNAVMKKQPGFTPVSLEQVVAAAQANQIGRANMVERLARIYRFWWIEEPARIEAHYRKHGLIR